MKRGRKIEHSLRRKKVKDKRMASKLMPKTREREVVAGIIDPLKGQRPDLTRPQISDQLVPT